MFLSLEIAEKEGHVVGEKSGKERRVYTRLEKALKVQFRVPGEPPNRSMRE